MCVCESGRCKQNKEQTYAFTDGQIWSYDLLGINQKYVPYVQMICWDINAA